MTIERNRTIGIKNPMNGNSAVGGNKKTLHKGAFFRSGWFVFWLIKCKSCGYPEYKGIEHNNKTDKAEPGKNLEVVFYDCRAQITEGLCVNFFNE